MPKQVHVIHLDFTLVYLDDDMCKRMLFNRKKSEDLCVNWNNPSPDNRLGSSSARKDWRRQ